MSAAELAHALAVLKSIASKKVGTPVTGSEMAAASRAAFYIEQALSTVRIEVPA